MTVEATVLASLIALPAMFTAGLARLAHHATLRWLATVYIEVFRGTSAIVQLFWVFFVLPELGVSLEPIVAGVLVLGLNAGAYGSEIVRGAILGVPRGQWEAATALNMSPALRMRRIILPQALPIMLPSFGNLLIEVLKATALLSLITVPDLTAEVSRLAVAGQLDFGTGYALLLVIYFLLALPLVAGVRRMERHTTRHLSDIQRPSIA